MSDQSLDIAVVITTFNRPQFLVPAIGSVLNQTRLPREIIVVDDGSSEETVAALQRFGSRVLHVRQENAGQQVARNRGVEEAKARWIATLDDDDLYVPDCLEQVEQAIQGSDANVIYADHRKFADDVPYALTNFESVPEGYWNGIPTRKSGWSFVGKFPIERLLRYIAFYPSTMTIRRDLYRELGGYDPKLRGVKAEDIEFLVRALKVGSLSIVWSPVVDYRIHGGNDTNSSDLSALGRLHIFETIRREHLLTPEFRNALDLDLPTRRAWALDQAFKVRNFPLVLDLAAKLHEENWTTARRVKRLMAALPSPVARNAADLSTLITLSAKKIINRSIRP